jgi:hypothetical protein
MITVTEPGGDRVRRPSPSCVEFARDGEDFTYVAASGITMTNTDTGNGEPDSGSYEVWEIDGEGQVQSIEFVIQSF